MVHGSSSTQLEALEQQPGIGTAAHCEHADVQTASAHGSELTQSTSWTHGAATGSSTHEDPGAGQRAAKQASDPGQSASKTQHPARVTRVHAPASHRTSWHVLVGSRALRHSESA